MRGVFALAQEPGALIWTLTSISFGLRIHGIGENGGPWPVYVPGNEKRPECPGDFDYPEAAPGYLCVYESYRFNVEQAAVCEHHYFWHGDIQGGCDSDPYGVVVLAKPTGAGAVWLVGSWAATADTSAP